jgi:hypothetical protein
VCLVLLHCRMACGQVWGCNAVAHRLDAPSTSASGATRRSRDRRQTGVPGSALLQLCCSRLLADPKALSICAVLVAAFARGTPLLRSPIALPSRARVTTLSVECAASLSSPGCDIMKRCAAGFCLQPCLQLQRMTLAHRVGCMPSAASLLPMQSSSPTPHGSCTLAQGTISRRRHGQE